MNLGNKIRNAATRLTGRTGGGATGHPGVARPKVTGTGHGAAGGIGDRIRHMLRRH